MGKTIFRPLPAVLARVETCERENARLKRIGAVVLLVAAAGLLCALSAGGQQKANGGNTSGCKLGATWEPNCYETLVRARPTVESKTEYLARVADTLQAEINAVQEQARLSERVADFTDTQFKQNPRSG